MKTLIEVGQRLQDARKDRKLTQQDLASRTGLTPVTMRAVFAGKTDGRISTIMTLADQLGLELVLVPKEISDSLEPQGKSHAQVESKISKVIRRIGRADAFSLSQASSAKILTKEQLEVLRKLDGKDEE